jgi:N-acetylglucosaminyldiphosphoundecaprenol N-acetyl-beta-D-mannosaminyltransferase
VVNERSLDSLVRRCLGSDEELRNALEVPGTEVQTVNLHHFALLHSNPEFRRAYDAADYVTADGWPIAVALRRNGTRSASPTHRVTGSDLVESIMGGVTNFRRVGLLGGSEAAGDQFAEACRRNDVLLEFREHGDKRSWNLHDIVEELNSSDVDLLLVAVTPPDGQIISHQLHSQGLQASIIGVGGAIDMVTGARRRAPRIVQRAGMEWLFRLCLEPRRLLRRYTRECVPALLRLTYQTLNKQAGR